MGGRGGGKDWPSHFFVVVVYLVIGFFFIDIVFFLFCLVLFCGFFSRWGGGGVGSRVFWQLKTESKINQICMTSNVKEARQMNLHLKCLWKVIWPWWKEEKIISSKCLRQIIYFILYFNKESFTCIHKEIEFKHCYNNYW